MAKAKALRGQPAKPRAPVGPPAGAGVDRNYFASVVDELRKVVWPTWNELARMTGVVVTTVILMALIVSAADYGLGLVVKQLYASAGTSTAGSSGTPKGSQVAPNTPAASANAVPTGSAAPTSAPASTGTSAPASTGSTAPVTP